MISGQMKLALLSSVFFLTFHAAAGAQERVLPDNIPPALRDRAIILEIATRIIEQNQEVVWDSENTQVTIPGRPVGFRLVGTNTVIVVQFTPYIRPRGDNYLVAQGQIWVHVPDEGMSLHTSLQTIPMEFNELIYFFPLGSENTENQAQIEMQIILYPYSQDFSNSSSPNLDSPGRGPPDRSEQDPSDDSRPRSRRP